MAADLQIQSLPNNMVFTSGADLWILPDKKTSNWTSKIDWYLNFIVSKARTFKRSKLSESLHDIIKEEDLSLPEIASQTNSPLLIASGKYLPNESTVVIRFDENMASEWLDEIEIVWNRLNRPSLRVFLPNHFPEEEFIDFCTSRLNTNVSYVLENNLSL